jgi:hypothetical protein
MFYGLSKGISDNLYIIVMMGFATGNYLTRSTVYDFLLTKKLSLTFIMLLFISAYFLFYNFSPAFNYGD